MRLNVWKYEYISPLAMVKEVPRVLASVGEVFLAAWADSYESLTIEARWFVNDRESLTIVARWIVNDRESLTIVA